MINFYLVVKKKQNTKTLNSWVDLFFFTRTQRMLTKEQKHDQLKASNILAKLLQKSQILRYFKTLHTAKSCHRNENKPAEHIK